MVQLKFRNLFGNILGLRLLSEEMKFQISYHTLNESARKKCPCLRDLSIDQREIILRRGLSKSRLIDEGTELWEKIMRRYDRGEKIHLREDNIFVFFIERETRNKTDEYRVVSIDLIGNYESGFKLGTYLEHKGQEMVLT